MADAPHRPPLRIAVRRLAIAEVEALAAFARDIGLTVADARPVRVQTFHGITTPEYLVTGPGGKEATLTLHGASTPAAAVIYRNPARAAASGPRVALLAMVLPTIHHADDPAEAVGEAIGA